MRLESYKDRGYSFSIYSDQLLEERMYVLRKRDQALVIDPHDEEAELLEELKDVHHLQILLTHEHYDHICGVNWLRERFDCKVISSRETALEISAPNNKTRHFALLFLFDKEKFQYAKTHLKLPYVCEADIAVEEEEKMDWQGERLELFMTPGHSPGGMSILLNDRYLFSGDNLLGEGLELKSMTAKEETYRQTLQMYEQMQGREILVLPGHGEVQTLEYYIDKVKEYYGWN